MYRSGVRRGQVGVMHGSCKGHVGALHKSFSVMLGRISCRGSVGVLLMCRWGHGQVLCQD